MMMSATLFRRIAAVALVLASVAAAEREHQALRAPLLERRAARELRTLCTLRGGLGRCGRAAAAPPPAQPKGNMVQRVLEPLKAMVQRGMSPRTLAASLALGGACGVFPVPLTTWAVTLAANALVPALNPLAMQLANSVVTPLMVPLFPVFLTVAARIRGPTTASFRFGDIRAQFQKAGFRGALTQLREPLSRAVLGWAVLAPVLFVCFYALAILPAQALAVNGAKVTVVVVEPAPAPRRRSRFWFFGRR